MDDGFWNICSYKATRIIFQETGLRDKEIPGSENSTRTRCIAQLDPHRSSDSSTQILRIRLSGCWGARMQEFWLIEQYRGAPGQISPPGQEIPPRHQQATPSNTGGDAGEDSILPSHPLSIFVPIHQSPDTDQVRTVTSFAPPCSNPAVCPFLSFQRGCLFCGRRGHGQAHSCACAS